MRNLFVRCLFLLGVISLSPLALSQSAIFQDNVFLIPQGAALINGEARHYSNIKLAADPDGRFTLLEAQPSSLVTIDQVEIDEAGSSPFELVLAIAGSKSVPCVDLQEPAIIREGSTFLIALAETSMGPAETCIAVIDPFELRISLDVTGLAAGAYTARVNGVDVEFEL